MLDTETKKRIDDARDILVGKVPDPKSQVEQITIALVYKFMDDMDRASAEMGGKASFFSGEYKRYSWSKIFDPKIGGTEMLNLYSEALIKLNQNSNIPQLFRDIFKNAYLPYRDPETLKLFLKTISEFTYDHSERLGDAFEYLLSVLGSQGDAGQFRTPRHIIDFMVEITDPKKNETVLDPACGTAGFLISSYKYILKCNTKKKSGDELNTAEKKKLLSNFKGYDISPDMVRLSLVNMYLHGFVQPEIMEYDTLTSEDRWKEYADVILANPPFMSPKGGIKPHKKFSVQSNRSEVLFVDYIAEHLTPTGRAAVIVPEGIIFQSAGAYKQLRKMLVENYLFAVVSLPAGVFNPYSGVKTSILLMDRNLCSKTDSVLFVKIENDGFGLGAQRKEVSGSDLPNAVSVIKKWKNIIHSDKQDAEELNPFLESGFALIVKKDRLAEKEEYNLTGDRYKVTQRAQSTQSWPMVKLGDVCKLGRGFAFKSDDYVSTNGILNFRVTNIGKDGKPDLTDAKYLPSKFQKDYDEYLLTEGDFVIVMVGATTGKIGKITKEILPA
ncbi:MAG TPA: N-6 DNA methylase, partial [Leptospiraceae bacterium]|nr:N-6 DNA methylase [Leptospiraceae bacterium]